jgi:hypothetical protein
MTLVRASRAGALAVVPLLLLPALAAAQDRDQIIRDALSAAPSAVAMHATVVDWEQNVLREGTNGWTCFPSPPNTSSASMCLDAPWLQWAQAWMTQEPVEVDRVGVSYMLQGDAGASATDPFAQGPTPDNDWVVSGPHIMILVPDNADLDGLPTDPSSGGPYVMWKGTPYAHIMIPVH